MNSCAFNVARISDTGKSDLQQIGRDFTFIYKKPKYPNKLTTHKMWPNLLWIMIKYKKMRLPNKVIGSILKLF